MEKEAQKPLAPPRIKNIDQVLRELGIGPGMPNQVHLTTPKVSLTKEIYTPSRAMAEVKNIATLMDVLMDKDFFERCPSIYEFFYISSKDIPRELIDSLESLGPKDQYVYFRIDREEGTLNPVSKREFNILSPPERGRLSTGLLEGRGEGRLLHINFNGTGWWVNYSIYSGDEGPRPVAFVESTY